MKISQKRTTKKPFIILAAIIVALLALAGTLYVTNTYPFNTSSDNEAVNYNESTDEQKEQGDKAKKDTINPASSENTTNQQDISKQEPDSQAPAPAGELTTVITAKDTDDQYLYIRSETQGVYAEGSCMLTLQKSDKTVTKTAGVQALPQSTTCKGFNVPLSELGSGKYAITLDVSAGGKKSTTKSEVTI